eukprot:6065426-Ditylum_brightwellii.AAC.1
MPYANRQQVMIWIDQKKPYAWDISTTSNWQWTPAVVTHYSDTPPSVTCVVMAKMFNMVDVKAIEADKGAGIGL